MSEEVKDNEGMRTRHPCCSPSSGEKRTTSVAVVPRSKIAPPSREAVDLPGGTFLMGTNYQYGFAADGEGPVRPVSLSPFRIGVNPVTNAEFAVFVGETGYITDSERYGWSFVFWSHIPADRFNDLVSDTVAAAPWWCQISGASWRAPEGPGSDILNRSHHPVVHVSWNDASAYAAWAGQSLPTEAQWEYAARGGLEQKLYPWGDELTPGGRHLCNVWQGEFPRLDTAEDGYAGTCPVDAFPPNGFGLYSMTGNVWEWCADWFTPFFVSELTQDPTGPEQGQAKVMKGGSFLCHASYCNRYRVAARTSNTPDSAASNVGFRCVTLPSI
jgi:formylglycine-generating enzyme